MLVLRPLLLAAALVATSAAVVPSASAWLCVPAMDAAAVQVDLGSADYYLKLQPSGGFWVQELWQESNGELGLQSSAGMSCVGRADTLIERACLGLCPLLM